MIDILCFIGIFIAGVLLGVVIANSRIDKPLKVGSFVITYNNPETDLIHIDLERDLPEIENAKDISFKVLVINGNNNNGKPLNE